MKKKHLWKNIFEKECGQLVCYRLLYCEEKF